MSRLIVWFLQKFPAPDRRAIYRAALGDLNHVRRREFLMRLIAEEYGYDLPYPQKSPPPQPRRVGGR